MISPGHERSVLSSLRASDRILIVRIRSIGDIVLLTPALRLLKQWRPDLRISVVVESRFRELLHGNPDVDDLLEIERAPGIKGAARRMQIVRAIRARQASVCLNLHGGPTSSFLTRMSGAKWKAGFRHFRQGAHYDILIPDARTILNQAVIHTAEHQASALFWLGLPCQEIPRARLVIEPADHHWWGTHRESLGVSVEQPYAIIHPTALYPTKQWSPEDFARLGAFLEKEAGIPAVFSAGPGESVVLDSVEKASGRAIRRLEGIPLGRFAAALAGARLFAGNDSGPAHMAAALERPSVVIFGSSSSAIWGPWPRADIGNRALVVQNFFECNPCPGDRCYRFDRPECILSVPFNDVRKAVVSILARSAHRMVSESSV